MKRLSVVLLTVVPLAVLLLIAKPTAHAANKPGDFSFCVIAPHGRCFTLKNEKLKSDSGELKLNQEQLKQITSEVQNFLSQTAYAVPYKNSGAANCRTGLRYQTESTIAERCAEKLTASDKARMQKLFELLSTGAN